VQRRARPEEDTFRRCSAVALALLLCYAVLTLWVRGRWALSAFQCGVFALGLTWIVRTAVRPLRLRFPFPVWCVAGAALWVALQLAAGWTVYRFETENALLHWLTALVLVAVAANLFSEESVRDRFLRAAVWFGFGLSVVSVLQWFTSPGKVFWIFATPYRDKVMGPFVYHNNYAAFIELLLAPAVWLAVADRRRTLSYAAAAAVMYATVIASTSRAGAALATVEVIAILVLGRVRGVLSGRRFWATAAALTGLAVLSVAVVGWEALWRRYQQADPYVHRRDMLLSALAMAHERPWTGFGLGTFQTVYPAYALFDIGLVVNHAHNDWAEWLAEGGVPFFLLLLSLAVWTLGPAVHSVWGLGLISVFVHALVDYPMQRLGLAAWIFVFVGALAGWRQQRRHHRARHPLIL
jgi:O-antigen ligase